MPFTQYSLDFKTFSDPEPLGLDAALLHAYGENILINFPASKEALVTRRGKLVYHFVNSHPRPDPRVPFLNAFYTLLQPFIPHIKFTKLNKLGQAWNGRSVTKCVLSALTGISLQQKIIQSLHQTLPEFLPGVPKDKHSINLYQLLTMTSGLPFTDKIPEMPRWLKSNNWVEHLLSLPLVAQPGEKFCYSTGNSHLLAAALNSTLQGKLYQFANDHLFSPLGIENPFWEMDPQGVPFGGANLFLPIEDMLKIGYLYLQGGRWQGQQIIPQKWVEDSIYPQVHARDQYDYGYAWWLRNFIHPINKKPVFVYAALGWAGQRIYVIPQLEMVVAAISVGDLWAKTENLDLLLEKYIIPAVR